MSNVYVRGVGLTKVGEHWSKSFKDLAVEAALSALEDAGWPSIDLLVVTNMTGEKLLSQSQIAGIIAREAGLTQVRALRVEAAQASGGVAVSLAASLVKTELYKNVLVVGVEKLRDVVAEEAIEALSMSEDAEYVQMMGANMYTLAGMLTRMYLNKYSLGYQELVVFPVIAHSHAVNSPHAQFRRAISVKHVLDSPIVSDPVRLLDSPPISDGAAALVLSSSSSESLAKILFADYVSGDQEFYLREDPLSIPGLKLLAGRARENGIDTGKLDFVELHDTFSVLAALILEELGVSERGKPAKEAASGRFNLDGELPISTFGGMKARGFPAGAAGIYQVVEAVLQVSGRAGKNQVQGASLGCTVNIGGFGTTVSLVAVGGVR